MSRGCKEPFLLFLCFYLLYAATSPGDLIADSQIRWRVAAQLVDTGWFDLPPEEAYRYAIGRDGKRYSFYGLAAWACLVPFVLAGEWLAVLLPHVGTPDMLGQFLASLLLFPACGALALVLVYSLALEASGDRPIARWIAIATGLATMHWHHSVSTGDEMQTAICILTCFWAFQRAWNSDHWRFPLLVCGAAGLGACVRISSLVVLVPVFILGLSFDLAARPQRAARRSRLRQWLVAAAVGLAPWAVLLGGYNAVRFGSPLQSGYAPALLSRASDMHLFQTPLLDGLTAMLFSPGKGVIVFNPLLLMAIPGLFVLQREKHRLAALIVVSFASSLIFHSKYTFWAGDFTWGPRYLASLMAVMMLGLIPILRFAALRALFVALFALSVPIQSASVIYNYGLEFFQDGRHGIVPDAYVWRVAESQLVCRFRNIALHALGHPDYACIPPPVERPELRQTTRSPGQVRRMHVVHFFPFKARANIDSRTVFAALLIL